MTTRWARFTRGWIAAAISVFVALCSHALAGGDVPSAAGIALCLAFAVMVCIGLAGKSLSLTRLSISVVFSQFIFHGLFSMLGDAPVSAPQTGMSMAQTMAQPTVHLEPLADTGMSMPAWMWAAHGIAALVTIAALQFGEGAFWRLVALARPLARRMLVTAPAPVTPFRVGPAPRRELLPTDRVGVLTVLRHRGPPSLASL